MPANLGSYVRGTWLRLRKVSKPALRDPFPTRGRKAGGFRDSRRSAAAISISLSEISFKIVSPDPVDAAARAAASFHAAELRSERRTCVRSAMHVAARGDVMGPLLLFPLCSSTRRRVAQAKFAGLRTRRAD